VGTAAVVTAFTLDSSNVWWVGQTGSQQALSRDSRSGGTSTPWYTLENNAVVEDIINDSDNVYLLVDRSGANDYTIRRVSKSAPETVGDVADPIGAATSLAQDQQYLYFGDNRGINRVLKNNTIQRPDLSWGYQGQIEIVQSTQDFAGTVQLIAGHTTLARVYPVATGGTVQRVPSYLHAFDTDGNELPGSPIGPDRPWMTPSSTAGDRGDLSASFNFIVPEDWVAVTRTIRLRADIDGANWRATR
jgi:hypothetical protein